jgi:hypothetical protein
VHRTKSTVYLEFPIWTSVSRILRFSCPRHNEFAIKADHTEIIGVPTAKSR